MVTCDPRQPSPGDIDPDISLFQQRTARDQVRYAGEAEDSLQSRRAIAEKVREPWRRGGPAMAETTQMVLPSDVRIRLYVPRDVGPGPVLVYLHGGGWVMFSMDTHDRVMREYASRANMLVIGVDYSLAPEAPYPRALDEISAVVDWIAEEQLGEAYENPTIILGGDSAGGNLAIATAMRRRDSGLRNVDGLLVNYGALDTEPRPSYEQYDEDCHMLRKDEMAMFWQAYLGTAAPAECPYARPLRLDAGQLPPAFFCIAECDILADENREMVTKLRQSGVEVTERVYPGATHSFIEAVSISSLASEAYDDAAAWLKQFI